MGARVVALPGLVTPGELLRLFPQPVAATAPTVRRPAIPVYAIERANRCPDCHGEAFFVGRVTAECAGCGLPMALVELRRLS